MTPQELEWKALPRSEREFALRWTAARVLFDLDGEGRPTGFVFEIGGDRRPMRVLRTGRLPPDRRRP